MLWLTSTLSTLSRLISKVRRLMKPVLWTTRMLVTSVSVVQRWNQAFTRPVQRDDRRHGRGRRGRAARGVSVAVIRDSDQQRQRPRSRPRSPADRRSSVHWWNTAPSRRAAGYRRYLAADNSASITLTPASATPGASPGGSRNPVACPQPRRYVYAPFGRRACGFRAGHTYLSSSGNAPVVMGRLVMKFGGTSVADLERIRRVAQLVKPGGPERTWRRRDRLGHGRQDQRAGGLDGRGLAGPIYATITGRATTMNMTPSSPPASRSPPASSAIDPSSNLGVPARSWLRWQVPLVAVSLTHGTRPDRGGSPARQARCGAFWMPARLWRSSPASRG